MCGIVGYVGDGQALPMLLEGMAKLEYRGYDSAGVAVSRTVRSQVRRPGGADAQSGRALKERTLSDGTTGIGHTRWATHGAPTDDERSPHVGLFGRIAVVHNGIIENHDVSPRGTRGRRTRVPLGDRHGGGRPPARIDPRKEDCDAP